MVSSTVRRQLIVYALLLFNTGLITAYLNPATGYEPSIYGGTPALFWVGSLGGLSVAVVISITSPTRATRRLAGFVGGIVMTTIACLPIIRGYHWLGESDSLTHLGYVVDLTAGNLQAVELRYPIVHTFGSVIAIIGGINLTHAMLLVISIFVVCYFVFVSMVVKSIATSDRAVYVGLFSGFLLLPINFIGVHMGVHPTSQAILFVPMLFYLIFNTITRGTWQFSALAVIVAPMFVLLHPQQAANLILFFGAITGTIVVLSLLKMNPQTLKQLLLPQATILACIFWIWVQNLPAFESSLGYLEVYLLRNTGAATEIGSRVVSVQSLGGSIEGVFLKLFLPAVIYCIFAGALMAIPIGRFLSGRSNSTTDGFLEPFKPNIKIWYFTVGFIPLVGIFFVYVIANLNTQYFRHYGFIMVVVTVVGAIAIDRLGLLISKWSSPKASQLAIVLIIGTTLCLSLPVMFPSPYIYQTSGHVTEAQMSGYETAFQYKSDEIQYDHIRASAGRYGDAIDGESAHRHSYYYKESGETRGIADHFANQSLHDYYNERTYVTVTAADRVRDPVVYQGFRFDTGDFEYLESDTNISKVQSGDGLDVYLVQPD